MEKSSLALAQIFVTAMVASAARVSVKSSAVTAAAMAGGSPCAAMTMTWGPAAVTTRTV